MTKSATWPPPPHVFPQTRLSAPELTYYLQGRPLQGQPAPDLTVADAEAQGGPPPGRPASGLHRVDLRLPAPAGARGGRGGPPDNDDIEEAGCKEEQMEAAEKAEAAAEAAMATGQRSSAQELQQANPGGERGGERAGEAAAQRGSDPNRSARKPAGQRRSAAVSAVEAPPGQVWRPRHAQQNRRRQTCQPRTFAVMLFPLPPPRRKNPKTGRRYDPRSAPRRRPEIARKTCGRLGRMGRNLPPAHRRSRHHQRRMPYKP